MILMKIYFGGGGGGDISAFSDISGVLPSPDVFAVEQTTVIYYYILVYCHFVLNLIQYNGFHYKYMNKSDLQHTNKFVYY